MQVPIVSLAAPEAEAAAVLRRACIEDGFFYREHGARASSRPGTHNRPCLGSKRRGVPCGPRLLRLSSAVRVFDKSGAPFCVGHPQ